MKRRILLLALGVAIISLTIVALKWKDGGTPKDGGEQTIQAAIARNYDLAEQSHDQFSERRSYRRGDEELELEIITGLDAESAKIMIDDGVMGVHALYADALSAYPESLSRQIKTPERFQPVLTRKEINGAPCAVFTLYATDRRAYGALSDDTAKLRSLLAWFYVPTEQTVYKIRIFAPLSATPEQLQQKLESILTR